MVVIVIGNFPVCAIQVERRQDRVFKAVKVVIKSGFCNETDAGEILQNFFAGSLMEELLLYAAEFPFGMERFVQLLSLTILPV